MFRRRRGGARFGREEIWEAEPANLNSKYQISYRLIFVLVSSDLTSRHDSILRNMLEEMGASVERALINCITSRIRHWPDVT